MAKKLLIRMTAFATAMAMVVLGVGVAWASSTSVAVADVTAPTGSVSLQPGESAAIGITITVSGNQEGTATFDVQRNWSLQSGAFTGSSPQEFTVAPQSGGTTTTFNATGTITASCSQAVGGPFRLAVQVYDITNSNQQGAKLAAGSASTYDVTVSGSPVSSCTTSSSDTTNPTVDCATAPTTWSGSDHSIACTAADNVALSSSSPASFSLSTTVAAGQETSNASTGTRQICDTSNNCVTAGPITGLKVDKKAPAVAYTSASPAANLAGWNNTNVTATFTATDGGSGFASGLTTTGTSVASTEGAAVTIGSPAFTDLVGNSAVAGAATSASFQIDKTAPSVTVTGVVSSATYTLGSVPTAGCDTTDGLSGVATYATLSSSGGPVGSVTATCNGGVDNAGNSQAAAVSSTYRVHYAFGGFQAPLNALPTRNTVKAGRAIPVKFSLGGDQGLGIFAGNAPTSSNITCSPAGTDEIEEVSAAGSSSLSYDGVKDEYTYVWKSDSAWAGKCRIFYLNLKDGTAHQVSFQFTK